MSDTHHSKTHSCCHSSTPAKAIDPVCGMTVDPASAAGSHAYGGTMYYFCSAHCVAKFKAMPERFVQPLAAPKPVPTSAPVGSRYTCPMHPEIVQKSPDTCPKCGMALEPLQP